MLKRIRSILGQRRQFEVPPLPPVPTSSNSNAAGSAFAVTSSLHGHMLTYTRDRVIGESLRMSGGFAEQDIDLARRILAELGITVDESLFLDIGANIGTHTIHALNSGFERAACIEPDPNNFKLLRINQILNEVDDRCINIFAAASDRDGSGELEKSPTNFGDHRIRIRKGDATGIHAEEYWDTCQVRIGRLGSLIANAGLSLDNVGMVWIDTQGHEGHVFAGCPALLQSKIPVVSEFWPYGLDRSGGWPIFREALAASGRRIYDLRCPMIGAREPISVSELEQLFSGMIAKETLSGSPHTDLLMI